MLTVDNDWVSLVISSFLRGELFSEFSIDTVCNLITLEFSTGEPLASLALFLLGDLNLSFFLPSPLLFRALLLSYTTMIVLEGLLGRELVLLARVSVGLSIGLKRRKPLVCSLSCTVETSNCGTFTPFLGV